MSPTIRIAKRAREVAQTAPDFALIILSTRGQLWTAQVGGVACLQPIVKGIAIELPPFTPPSAWENSMPPDFDGDPWGVQYESKDVTAELINMKLDLIVVHAYNHGFPTYREIGLPCSGLATHIVEAWVPVIVNVDQRADQQFRRLGKYDGRLAILTYPNSD